MRSLGSKKQIDSSKVTQLLCYNKVHISLCEGFFIKLTGKNLCTNIHDVEEVLQWQTNYWVFCLSVGSPDLKLINNNNNNKQ